MVAVAADEARRLVAVLVVERVGDELHRQLTPAGAEHQSRREIHPATEIAEVPSACACLQRWFLVGV